MNKKIILFDADGVIIRSEMFGTYYQLKHGLSPDSMSSFYTGIFQDCLKGKADLKEVLKPWLVRWKWQGDADGFLMQWFQHEHQIDRRMADLIAELRQNSIRCYLATNQEKYRTHYMRKEMGFNQVFDGVFSSAEIGSQKPQPSFFEFIFQKLGVGLDKILFTDDSPSHIEVAKKMGIDAFLYTEFEPFYEYVKPLLKKAVFHPRPER